MAILNPYLGFKDNARDAMEFYQSVFGGDLTLSTFAELHADVQPGEENLIMHSQLTTPSGFTLMGSDTPSHMDYKPGTNHSISLSGDSGDDTELRGYFDALAVGGTITQPLVVAPWGDAFGMVIDKFGETWLVNIAGAPS